jgi:ligand-binding SRPBCC domain-containing protein
MKQITIRSRVNGSPVSVYARFNRDLFMALAGTFPKVTLRRFDGCGLNDETHVCLHFFGKHEWVSRNTAFFESPEEIYFVDEGFTLPFGLKSWKHRHRITGNETGSIIHDEITYDFGNAFLNVLWWLPFYMQFAIRPRIYRKYFNLKNG